jgi:hypothetical protein
MMIIIFWEMIIIKAKIAWILTSTSQFFFFIACCLRTKETLPYLL